MNSLHHWVLDTNVVVSGLLSPYAPPGRLIDALLLRRLVILLDDRVIDEYRSVLSRPKFRIDGARMDAFLAILDFQPHLSAVSVPGVMASDPDDTKFLELALASIDRVLVTGNLKHYPRSSRGGVAVLSPAEAYEKLSQA